jgi:hypothetical protein
MNVTGGAGGSISVAMNSASVIDCAAATGGGAIGILGAGQDGGDATRTGTVAGSRLIIGGAASIGQPGTSVLDTSDGAVNISGKGVHSTVDGFTLGDDAYSKRALWGIGGSDAGTASSLPGVQGGIHPELIRDYCLFNLNGPGGYFGNAGVNPADYGYLGGSGGSMYTSDVNRSYTIAQIHGGAGGVGAGGGACMHYFVVNANPDVWVGGRGGNYGGGGGGCVVTRDLNNASAQAIGGPGGRGGVYIKIVEIY